jgi:FkbM family methyltransferase
MIDLLAWRTVKAWHVARAAWCLHRLPKGVAPPMLLDVGARGGPQRKWVALSRLARLDFQLVEPEAVEAQRLRRSWPRARIIQHALGEADGEAEFHANPDPGLSSLLPPQAAAMGQAHAATRMLVRRFDTLCRQGEAARADFVKIDTQGFELSVLKGMGGTLDAVLGLELEAQFAPLYRGQSLFHEIYDWLTNRGFRLVAMRPQGLIEHGIVEANFFFARVPLPEDQRSRVLAAAWRALNRIPEHRHYVLSSG